MNQSEKSKITGGKVLKYISIVAIILQVLASLFIAVQVFKFGGIPTKYEIIIISILLLFLVITVLLHFGNKVARIISIVLSVILSVSYILAFTYVSKLNSTLDKMTGNTVTTTKVSIVVKKDSDYHAVSDLKGKKFVTARNAATKYADDVISKVQDACGQAPDVSDYNDPVQAAKDLLDGKVEAFIMDEATRSDIEEAVDGFADNTHVLSDYTVEESAAAPESVKDIPSFNVFISGIDVTGDVSTKSRSDVNIIANVNTQTHTVLLLTTPRDYFIDVPFAPGQKDKLTHMGLYGVQTSMDTLENLYGIKLDHYMRMNFTGFTNIVDALGGVTVYSDYDFTTLNGGYHIEKGYNVLNGEAALGFARERYSLPDGDFQRGRDQMEVIKAIITKATSSAAVLTNYSSVLDSVSDCMQTNLSRDDINALIKGQLNDMKAWTVLTYNVSGTCTSSTMYSYPTSPKSVVIPDESTVEYAKKLMQKVTDGETVTQDDISAMR